MITIKIKICFSIKKNENSSVTSKTVIKITITIKIKICFSIKKNENPRTKMKN